MKRVMILAFLTTLFALTWYINSHAASKDEKNNISQWSNQNTNKPKAETKIQEQFGASDSQINNLRQQRLSYGEIRQTLSLAQRMPGGITDQNLQKVVDARQGSGYKLGWEKVAQQLGVDASTDRQWNQDWDKKSSSQNSAQSLQNAPEANPQSNTKSIKGDDSPFRDRRMGPEESEPMDNK